MPGVDETGSLGRQVRRSDGSGRGVVYTIAGAVLFYNGRYYWQYGEGDGQLTSWPSAIITESPALLPFGSRLAVRRHNQRAKGSMQHTECVQHGEGELKEPRRVGGTRTPFAQP